MVKGALKSKKELTMFKIFKTEKFYALTVANINWGSALVQVAY